MQPTSQKSTAKTKTKNKTKVQMKTPIKKQKVESQQSFSISIESISTNTIFPSQRNEENHVHYRHCRCGAIQRGYQGKQTGKPYGFWISPSGFSQNTKDPPPPATAANSSTIYSHWIPSLGANADSYSIKNAKNGKN